MPLDLKRLEQLVDLANGVRRARCPACAEQGQDRTGEHLRIYPDGRFGCCVFPKDREHRKRIFALAGGRSRQAINVRVAVAKATAPVLSGVLGRLGRVFATPNTVPKSPDASDGSARVGERTAEGRAEVRTPRTGVGNSRHEPARPRQLTLEESRTLRTGFENPRVYVEKVPSGEGECVHTHKEFREGVRSVRAGQGVEPPPEAAGKQVRMPHFTPGGALVIPFESPERFHWWKNGQSVAATIAEVRSWEAAKQEEDHGHGV